MANPWFRLYSEFSTDPKVQMLSEALQRRLVMLFCFRCSNDTVTLQDDEVTFLLRISNEEWQKTKQIFIEKGFINSQNEVLNWEKRQFKSDTSKDRVARHREKKREDKNECNVTVTPPEQIQNRTDTEDNSSTNVLLVGKSQEAPLPPDGPLEPKNKKPQCPHQDIIAIYHENLPMCPGIKQWTKVRAKKLRNRWDEDQKRQNVEWWVRFFNYVAQSKFLTGRGPPRDGNAPFLVDLEWLISPTNMTKVIEGKYHRNE